MNIFKECVCPVEEDISIDLEITEDEDFVEVDPDELTEDTFLPHNKIWQEISDKFDKERQQTEQYRSSKISKCEVPLNPAVKFLEEKIFPLLVPEILEATITKAKDFECIKYQKHSFNSIDLIAEMLWNLNPKHPERKKNWKYIFDIEWVATWLNDHPRPFYPFSWIWSRDYAALKIQAGMRGYWVRRREDVQEMRQFWKVIVKENERSSHPFL